MAVVEIRSRACRPNAVLLAQVARLLDRDVTTLPLMSILYKHSRAGFEIHPLGTSGNAMDAGVERVLKIGFASAIWEWSVTCMRGRGRK